MAELPTDEEIEALTKRPAWKVARTAAAFMGLSVAAGVAMSVYVSRVNPMMFASADDRQARARAFLEQEGFEVVTLTLGDASGKTHDFTATRAGRTCEGTVFLTINVTTTHVWDYWTCSATEHR